MWFWMHGVSCLYAVCTRAPLLLLVCCIKLCIFCKKYLLFWNLFVYWSTKLLSNFGLLSFGRKTKTTNKQTKTPQQAIININFVVWMTPPPPPTPNQLTVSVLVDLFPNLLRYLVTCPYFRISECVTDVAFDVVSTPPYVRRTAGKVKRLWAALSIRWSSGARHWVGHCRPGWGFKSWLGQ